MKNLRKRLACLLLSALLLIGCLPVTALAAENGFILVVEAGGKLVIAPEYISCTAGQTAAQALSASGHTFTGLDTGMISAIDGVTGNFTRSDGIGRASPVGVADHRHLPYFRKFRRGNQQG